MKARLITAFTIIILIPMLIISFIISINITTILDRETDDKLSFTLFDMNKEIFEDIEKIKNRINLLKIDPNVIEGVGFKDGSKFMGLIESAKNELDLEYATVYAWKEGMPEHDRSRFIVLNPDLDKIETTLSDNSSSDESSKESTEIVSTKDNEETKEKQNEDILPKRKRLVYIEDALIKDRNKIVGIIRFQIDFNDKYLEKKVSNFQKLAGIEAALLSGKESLASTFGTSIKLEKDPADIDKKLDLTVQNIPYQAKQARITDSIGGKSKEIHFLVGLSKKEATETINVIIFLILIIASLSTVTSILIGYIFAGWLARKMNKTVSVVNRIAGGDLTETVHKSEIKKSFVFRKDEMSMVLESVSGMSEELINIVRETMKVVEVVVEMAGELHESNQQLSQRAEIQASSIEEISATLEQMTSTIKSTANNSRKVRDLVEETQNKINQGEMIIEEAIMAMNLISESSKKISNITNVVDDIAFQTNLLSLNASVEAARAGEQGKGFAVVANEVRNLAQLSANSVNDIKKLIENTSDRVDKGSALVNNSGKILQEVIEKVKKVSVSMQEVAEASVEQEIGIHHVNDAVQQIDSMIQKNTILADRTMVLSNKMDSMASELQKLMSFFRLKEADYHSIKKQTGIDVTKSSTSSAEDLFNLESMITHENTIEENVTIEKEPNNSNIKVSEFDDSEALYTSVENEYTDVETKKEPKFENDQLSENESKFDSILLDEEDIHIDDLIEDEIHIEKDKAMDDFMVDDIYIEKDRADDIHIEKDRAMDDFMDDEIHIEKDRADEIHIEKDKAMDDFMDDEIQMKEKKKNNKSNKKKLKKKTNKVLIKENDEGIMI